MHFDQAGRPSAAEAISRIAVYDSDEPTNEEVALKKKSERRKTVLENWQMLVDVKPWEDGWKVQEVRRQSKMAYGEVKGF